MGFRFYRRLKIAPGIYLNFSKSGISTSIGPRGAKVTVSKRGIRKTVGIPGTGIHYTEYRTWDKLKEYPSFITCPKCNKKYPFDKRMIGEELICPCGYRFSLEDGIRANSAVSTSFGEYILGFLIVLLIFAGICFCVNSCNNWVARSQAELRAEQENTIVRWALEREITKALQGNTYFRSIKIDNLKKLQYGDYEVYGSICGDTWEQRFKCRLKRVTYTNARGSRHDWILDGEIEFLN